jgi:hypothetical protein
LDEEFSLQWQRVRLLFEDQLARERAFAQGFRRSSALVEAAAALTRLRSEAAGQVGRGEGV